MTPTENHNETIAVSGVSCLSAYSWGQCPLYNTRLMC